MIPKADTCGKNPRTVHRKRDLEARCGQWLCPICSTQAILSGRKVPRAIRREVAMSMRDRFRLLRENEWLPGRTETMRAIRAAALRLGQNPERWPMEHTPLTGRRQGWRDAMDGAYYAGLPGLGKRR